MEVKFRALKKIIPNVSRETFEALLFFEDLLKKWSKSFNLISPKTCFEIWDRHILDSAQVFLHLRPNPINVLDIGSGAGFPALVLLILLKDNVLRKNENVSFFLVEKNYKKAAFLNQVALSLNLPAKIISQRIETLDLQGWVPNVITARALASLSDLFVLTERWFTEGVVALFQKGKNYRLEVEESTAQWNFNLVEYKSITCEDSVILKITELCKISRGF